MIKTDPTTIIDQKFLGIPYQLGGKSFEGADCMGLLLLWYKEQGIEFEYSESLSNKMKTFWERRPAEFLSVVSKYGSFIPFHEIQKYDFILFFADKREAVFPSYPAVMVDDRYFLSNFDKTVSKITMLDMEWKNRFWGAIKVSQAIEMGVR